MLSALGLAKTASPATEGTATGPRPVCAVSKIMARDGVERGQKLRVKYVVPEEHRAAAEGRRLWLGLYREGGTLTAVPAVRCTDMEGVVELDTAGLETGAHYVCSLREGEVWPLITTHSTSERVLIREPPPEPEAKPPPPAQPVPQPDAQLPPQLPAKPSRAVAISPRRAVPENPEQPASPVPAAARPAAGSGGSSGSGGVSPRRTQTAAAEPVPAPALAMGSRRTGRTSAASPGGEREEGQTWVPPASPKSRATPPGSPRGLPPLPLPPAEPRPAAREASSSRRPAAAAAAAAAPAAAVSPRESEGAGKRGVPEKLIVRMLEELSIRTRVHEGREVPLSFTGISLVSWLCQTVKTIETREEAAKWARAMLRQDVFFPAEDGAGFADEHLPYVLNLDHPVVGREWARIEAAGPPGGKLVRRPSAPSVPGPPAAAGGSSPRRTGGPRAAAAAAASKYADEYK